MTRIRNCVVAFGLLLATTTLGPTQSAIAASATELNTDGKAALDRLYAESDRARRFGRDARAILVFPRIVKAGLVVGGQSGEGVLFVNGEPVGYYRISAASVGLQAGGQTFGYALFLMNDTAVNSLGLKAFFFTLKLEKCATVADLKPLAGAYREAIAKGSGDAEAEVLSQRLQALLG